MPECGASREIPLYGWLSGADLLGRVVLRNLRVPLFCEDPRFLRVLRGYVRLVGLAVVTRAYDVPPSPGFKARRLAYGVIGRLPFRSIYQDGT